MLVLVVLLTIAIGWVLIYRARTTFGDEYASLPQIQRFLAGDWSVQKNLAVPPVYHALVAGLARLFGVSSIDGLRLISLLLSLPVVPLFHLCARKIDPDSATVRTLQLLFLPILLPYLFLLYTDPLALLFLVFALCLALYDRPWLAGLAALLDVLVRQNQIVWVAWLFAWLYLRHEGARVSLASAARHLVRCWTFCLVFVGFLVFLVVNRGRATLGQHEDFHRPGLYAGNVFFALFLCSLLFLPVFLAGLPRTVRLLLRRPWLLVGVGLLLLVFLTAFKVRHQSNDVSRYPEFLRNQLLALVMANLLTRTLFFAGIAFAVLSLAALPLQQPWAWLIYPFWVLSVLPVELIEQRYSLAGVVLLLLFRKAEGPLVEALLLGWWVLLSAGALVSLCWFRMFL